MQDLKQKSQKNGAYFPCISNLIILHNPFHLPKGGISNNKMDPPASISD